MCGIVAIAAHRPVAPLLLEALDRLEYRGYDSAGLASYSDGQIQCRRAVGKLEKLREEVEANPVSGDIGLGHTRWATHGAVNLTNAHPHATDRVAVVHNGIVENYRDLRTRLENESIRFSSDTDTEVIVKLMSSFLGQNSDPLAALLATCEQLRGSFSLAMLLRDHPDCLLLVNQGAALVIGETNGEIYAASDSFALTPLTDRFCHLQTGDRALLRRGSTEIVDQYGSSVEREWVRIAFREVALDKGNYRHYMSKEIFQQPEVVSNTLGAYVDVAVARTVFPELPFDPSRITKLDIIACGTAYFAGMVAKYWLEEIARMPAEADISSEFRYRHSILEPGGIALFISQSGETADTLAALRHCKDRGQANMAIVNAPESTIARETDALLPIFAEREISVASTKTFTCQLVSLAALSIYLARTRGVLEAGDEERMVTELSQIPRKMQNCLALEDDIRRLARSVVDARQVLYIGRGIHYPLALEGALKLKEISYLAGEGYAAGELKHGPIALIDGRVVVVAIAPSGPLFDKIAANIQEVAARGGQVILLTDHPGAQKVEGLAFKILELPEATALQSPLLYALPLQLLAYHCALERGTDVDQPRNLAKSVTVE